MPELDRRRFLRNSAACLAALLPAAALWPVGARRASAAGRTDIRGRVFAGDAPANPWKWSVEGRYCKELADDKVACGICPHRCVLSPGDRGVCRNRVNIDGRLYSLAYGNPCAVNVDPVEKKPLYHFTPRAKVFSVATTGCNFRCLNCQNWEISQAKPHEVPRYYELSPRSAVNEAELSGSTAVAYTYSEPTAFFEYMLATAGAARSRGLHNLWISNGYINRTPLLELCQVLDGANVNLKAFSDDVYRRLNGGRLQPVLRTFRTLHEQGVHFEMTNLVVPGYADDDDMVKRMCDWTLANVGPDYPLHFLRFFPRYKLDRLPPTPVATLERFRGLALAEGIRYVYIGNVAGHEANHTYCHNCGKLIIERQGYFIPTFHLDGDRCRFCGTRIPGVWSRGHAGT